MLQWSPVLETGNTRLALADYPRTIELQWSPVLETGNTVPDRVTPIGDRVAAMEPGLRDREYLPSPPTGREASKKLQWSPVLETGNTRG